MMRDNKMIEHVKDKKRISIGEGFQVGCILSAILSYALNKSLVWMILHAIFGWYYILYAVLVRGKEIVPAIKNLFF